MEENREPVVNQEGTTEHVEFQCFWEHWKTKKNAFENLRQRWDVGKVEIKLLCQQHTANSRTKVKQAIKALERLVQVVQRQLVSFFWSGQHWVRAAVLYLPVQEGGQKLVDIRSRIVTFRLQAAQKLLYHSSMSWTDTATVLLRKASEMGLDKHLFLMNLRETGLANLTPFYRSVLEAWRILSFSRMPDATAGAWLLEEPLFNNHLLNPRVLCSASLCSRLRTSGYTKLGHIVSTGWAAVRERTRIRSQRLLDKLAAETVGSLPAAYQELLNDPTVIDQWREGGQYEFPSLNISAAVEEWQEDERLILSFTTLELGTFELAGKKALYMLCV
ncbi:hypothetical protein QTP86_024079, partial [Hemibagrus guttatus]